MSTASAPSKLLDAKQMQEEYGFSETTAYKIMRHLPRIVEPQHVRKVYVYREDVDRYIAEATRER